MLIIYPDTVLHRLLFWVEYFKDMTVLVGYRISHVEYLNQNMKQCLPPYNRHVNKFSTDMKAKWEN